MDLREATHDMAITALRQTPAVVRLVVLRDESQFKDEGRITGFVLKTTEIASMSSTYDKGLLMLRHENSCFTRSRHISQSFVESIFYAPII